MVSQWDVVSNGDVVSSGDVASSGDAGDVLGSGREGRPRGPRRVVALSTAVLVTLALAGAAAWGGGWWQRRELAARDARVTQVTFALLAGSTVNVSDPTQQEVSWTAILVNTGPTAIQVDSATWGGEPVPSALHVKLAPHASQMLVFTSTFACATDGSTSSLPLPLTSLRLRSFDGTVTRKDAEVLNPVVWSSTVFQACSQVSQNVENSVYPSGDETVTLQGKVLLVHIVLVNQGPIASGTNSVQVAGEGFVSTASPAEVSGLPPGATRPVDISVQVSDCALAAQGSIEGLVVTPDNQYGADATLIRGMDRLVQASCPG